MTRVAVIDIGKTNAKLALVEGGTLAELAVVTRPNVPLSGPPHSRFDVDGLRDFLLAQLAAFHAARGVDAVSVTTHGACGVLLDAGGNPAAPVMDYEDAAPAALAADYDRLRPSFDSTGSPRMGQGLNLGAQLHWQLASLPGLRARVDRVVTWPQFWGALLTGETACDLCSLGCHTDLWDPFSGTFSALVERLGLSDRMAPPRRPDEVLGQMRAGIAAATGLPRTTPVMVGIHDSNASLFPYLSARDAPFAVVSTGTWVVCMAVGGKEVARDGRGDIQVGTDAFGRTLPSARFMGGRMFEALGAAGLAPPDASDRVAVLARGVGLRPARDSVPDWAEPPQTPGERALALSWALAVLTRDHLDRTGSRGPVIVEGPFARNPHFMEMLAALSPEGTEAATSATGTAVGAAMLALGRARAPETRPVPAPPDAAALRSHAARSGGAQGGVRA
ncbi:MAG TPA: FGGY family carbohydrate kinase [Paracoccaceae bacterium]|nr:FGGY family carbohydrate kinase [Paracoccaceae bacterium]HMO70951.1 FGGY family carbohydrate kinase [Paracoccaceae bacterium]